MELVLVKSRGVGSTGSSGASSVGSSLVVYSDCSSFAIAFFSLCFSVFFRYSFRGSNTQCDDGCFTGV